RVAGRVDLRRRVLVGRRRERAGIDERDLAAGEAGDRGDLHTVVEEVHGRARQDAEDVEHQVARDAGGVITLRARIRRRVEPDLGRGRRLAQDRHVQRCAGEADRAELVDLLRRVDVDPVRLDGARVGDRTWTDVRPDERSIAEQLDRVARRGRWYVEDEI